MTQRILKTHQIIYYSFKYVFITMFDSTVYAKHGFTKIAVSQKYNLEQVFVTVDMILQLQRLVQQERSCTDHCNDDYVSHI